MGEMVKTEDLLIRINDLIAFRKIEDAKNYFYSNKGKVQITTEVAILNQLFCIYDLEKGKNIQESYFENIVSVEEAIDRYETIKFFLRRVEFDLPVEEKMQQYIFDNAISWVAILQIIKGCIVDKVNTIKKVSLLLFERHQIDDALNLLLYAYRLQPEDEEILYNLAYIFCLNKNYKLANAFAEKIKAIDADIEELKIIIERGLENEGQ